MARGAEALAKRLRIESYAVPYAEQRNFIGTDFYRGGAVRMDIGGLHPAKFHAELLRVADALGAQAIIAPKDRAAGINATVEKVASGAAETVPFIAVTNLARAMRDLKDRGIWLIGADQNSDAELYSVKLTAPVAWVIGAEGEGMRRLTRETCDEVVRIPMVGTVESLNVAVTAGICLAETRRQRSSGDGHM